MAPVPVLAVDHARRLGERQVGYLRAVQAVRGSCRIASQGKRHFEARALCRSSQTTPAMLSLV